MDGGSARLGTRRASSATGPRRRSGGSGRTPVAAIDVTVPHRSRSSEHDPPPCLAACRPTSVTVKEGIPVTRCLGRSSTSRRPSRVDVVMALLQGGGIPEPLGPALASGICRALSRADAASRKVRLALEAPEGRTRRRRKSTQLEERFAPFLAGTTCPYPASTTGSSSAASATRSTATGRSTNQIVELDGWEGHGTRSAFREDRARDRRLARRRLHRHPPHLEPARRRTRGDRL